MTDHRAIVNEQEDISWSDVIDAVEDKKKSLKSKERYYKNEYPITQTVVVQQESDPVKLLVLDEIRYSKDNYQYRFGYWIVSDKKLEKGNIAVVFGQFASVIPPTDLQRLLEKAKQTSWEGPAPLR